MQYEFLTDDLPVSCFQFLCIPFAIHHPAVAPISSTSSDWLGQWSETKTGKWIDDAFLLVWNLAPERTVLSLSTKLQYIVTKDVDSSF